MVQKKIKLSLLQEKVAKNIQGHIETTKHWVSTQEEKVNDIILSGSSTESRYDLRQTIQAFHTAKNTLQHLIDTFEDYVGCSYDGYCKSYKVTKVTTPEDKLLVAIQEMIKKG